LLEKGTAIENIKRKLLNYLTVLE